jgi:hypothetical protein
VTISGFPFMQMMLLFYQANIKLSEGYILHTLDIFAGANGQKTNMKKNPILPHTM